MRRKLKNMKKVKNGQEKSNKINDSETYKSSKLILEHIYKDYSREIERRKSIETRIPILVTIATFFGGLLLVNNTINFTSMLENGNKSIFIAVTLQAFSCVCLLGAIVLFLSLLISRPYRSIKTDSFLKLGPQGEDEGLVAYDLIEAYKICTDYNKEINNKKHERNNLGVILLMFSILFYIILRIFIICI